MTLNLSWASLALGATQINVSRYADRKLIPMKQQDIPEELDRDKLAEVALGLLALTLHDGCRAWKGLDWSVMDLLYERGWISDPASKAKSVLLTDAGVVLAEQFLRKHFRLGGD